MSGAARSAGTRPDPENPTDDGLRGPLEESKEEADEAGTDQFQAADDGQVRCLTCRHLFPADSQRADGAERVEGVSDPADMSFITVVTCPHCGARGSLILRYGPEASAEEASVLVALRRG